MRNFHLKLNHHLHVILDQEQLRFWVRGMLDRGEKWRTRKKMKRSEVRYVCVCFGFYVCVCFFSFNKEKDTCVICFLFTNDYSSLPIFIYKTTPKFYFLSLLLYSIINLLTKFSKFLIYNYNPHLNFWGVTPNKLTYLSYFKFLIDGG